MPLQNQKIENLLNLALEATPSERSRSESLTTGYQMGSRTWKVIVKYSGFLPDLALAFPDVSISLLSNQYAILTIPEAQLSAVSESPLITFMEKPKRLFFAAANGRSASCITPVQNSSAKGPSTQIPGMPDGLSGSGTFVGIIDSGIDYAHPDFRNPDQTTRIYALWDQSLQPQGTYFASDIINKALEKTTAAERYAICPSRDLSGHGTHVAGIAAGNGRASDGRNRGVAYEAMLIIVKLSAPDPEGFPSTTELMQAADFVVRLAEKAGRPLALNLSFGNSYGSHSGTSLLETFLNDISGIGKTTICTGCGNEGSSAGHTCGILKDAPDSTLPAAYTGAVQRVEFITGDYEPALSIQLWKNYFDRFSVQLIDPSGTRSIAIDPFPGTGRYRLPGCELLVYYGEPSPYSRYQEIYFDFLPLSEGGYLPAGIWTLVLTAQSVVTGIWDMWMPSAAVRGAATRFLNSTPENTLTIPSTAAKLISVSAYDSAFQSLAAFSGRGYTWDTRQQKPDLAAPGIDILSCAPGGGYETRSGTSMATPFVTGSAALLMQYGIVNGADPFLYGEKLKAFLLRGAKHIPAETTYPNRTLGFGTLCLKDSIPL